MQTSARVAGISFFLPDTEPTAECSGVEDTEWLTINLGSSSLTIHGSYQQLSDFGDAVCRAIVDARLSHTPSRRQDEDDEAFAPIEEDDYGLERDHLAHEAEEAEQVRS